MGSGDWCFKDGKISFAEIFELYKYFRGKVLTIVVDCCYAGQWVLQLAECLTLKGIGACGHCARAAGVGISIIASCLPNETAGDGTFGQFGFTSTNNHLSFYLDSTIWCKQTGWNQTTCHLDSTKIRCCAPPPRRCNWLSSMSAWNWHDLADPQQRRDIQMRLRMVTTINQGGTWWCIILVSCSLSTFDSMATITSHLAIPYPSSLWVMPCDLQALSNYGYMIAYGPGLVPPQEIANIKLSPSVCHHRLYVTDNSSTL